MIETQLKIPAFWFLTASVAFASSPTALVPAGRCDDSELIQTTRALGEALRRDAHLELIDLGTLPRPFLPQVVDQSEIAPAVEDARTRLYRSDYAEAEKRLSGALKQVRGLPPSAVRRDLELSALRLLALVLRAQGRFIEADGAFRTILRIDSRQQLDPDFFSPSLRTRFEELRAELSAAPKLSLTITSNLEGLDVFVDGYPAGVTPWKKELAPGEYQIVLHKDGSYSLPRAVSLVQQTAASIDFEFESTLRNSPGGLCLSEPSGGKAPFAQANKVAGLSGASQVVLTSIERRDRDVRLNAVLIDTTTDRIVRSGSAPVENLGSVEPAFGRLAVFLVSGAGDSEVRRAAESRKGTGWKAPLGFGLVAAGVISGGIAAVFALESNRSWRTFNGYFQRPDGPTVDEAAAAAAIRDRAESQRTTAIVAGAIGAAVVGSGLYFLLTSQGSPEPATPVAFQAQIWPLGFGLVGRWR